jgi:hypothetical protein
MAVPAMLYASKNWKINRSVFSLKEVKVKLAWMYFKNDSRLPKILLNYKPRGYQNIG